MVSSKTNALFPNELRLARCQEEAGMKKHGSLFVVALALLSISIAFAGEPAGPPQPTPEHKALEIWVGTWTGSAEMKPGPLGPGGPISWTEECSWFGGAGFHVFCESKGSGPTGPTQGIGIMGYNAQKKVYTHYGIDSDGWSGGGEGTRSGDRCGARGRARQ